MSNRQLLSKTPEPSIANHPLSAIVKCNSISDIPLEIDSSFKEEADDSDEHFEEDLFLRDPELFKITERNRQIGTTAEELIAAAAAAATGACCSNEHNNSSDSSCCNERSPHPVFSEQSSVTLKEDALIVTFYYGLLPPCAGKGLEGCEPEKQQQQRQQRQASNNEPLVVKRRPKQYMFMCDLKEESIQALRWGVNTLLRDGDVIHVVCIIHVDEEIMMATGSDIEQEEKQKAVRLAMERYSERLNFIVRAVLEEMVLYNIEINTYSAVGKTKQCLLKWIQSTPKLTMVICGMREAGAIRRMLMGGISSFLVQNSPIPVGVVRSSTGKKKPKLTAAQSFCRRISNQQAIGESTSNTRRLSTSTLNSFNRNTLY